MSDCSTNAFQPVKPIKGRIVWKDGQRPTPLDYARYVNGAERVAVYIELDGERYERVRECRAIAIYNMHDEWCGDECSACGYEWYEDEPNYCPNCGAKVVSA